VVISVRMGWILSLCDENLLIQAEINYHRSKSIQEFLGLDIDRTVISYNSIDKKLTSFDSSGGTNGKLQPFLDLRPTLDREITVNVLDKPYSVSLNDLKTRGYWKVQLSWTEGERITREKKINTY